MSFAVFLDVIVALLLCAAIAVALVLNRRLAAFRAAKAEFEQVIERFNTAATRAEAGVNALKLTGDSTGRALQQCIARAQSLRDELAFLVERAEPVTDRLSSAHRAAAARPPAGIAVPSPAAPKPAQVEPAAPTQSDLLKTLSALR